MVPGPSFPQKIPCHIHTKTDVGKDGETGVGRYPGLCPRFARLINFERKSIILYEIRADPREKYHG